MANNNLPVPDPKSKNKDTNKTEKKRDNTQWNLADIASALVEFSNDMLILSVALKGTVSSTSKLANIDTNTLNDSAKKLSEASDSISSVLQVINTMQESLSLMTNDKNTALMMIAPGIFRKKYSMMIDSFSDIFEMLVSQFYPIINLKGINYKLIQKRINLLTDTMNSTVELFKLMQDIGNISLGKLIKLYINVNMLVYGSPFANDNSEQNGIITVYMKALKILCNQDWVNKRQLNKLNLVKNSAEILNQIVNLMSSVLATIVLLAPVIKLGGMLLLGPRGDGNGGLIGILGGFAEYVSKNEKIFRNAKKSIVYISAAIGILSASIALLIGVGMLLVNPIAWLAILQISALMTLLVGSFMLLGLSTHWIKEGGKTLLYISASIAILATTAALIALLGVFIATSWKAILMVGALTTLLVGSFVLLAFASRWINEGCKEMLFIASAVAIIGLTATLMVLIADEVTENWEGMKQVFAIVGLMTAMMIALAIASNFINKGSWMLLLMVVPIVAMVGVIYLLSNVVDNIDMPKLWGGFGLMMAILGGFTAFTAALAFIPGIQIGVAMLGLLTIQIGIVAGSMLMMADVIERMNALDYGGDEEALKEKAMLPVNTFMAVVKALASNDEIKVKDYRQAARKMKHMRSIAQSVSKIAETLVGVAELRYADEFDEETGKPTHYVTLESEHITNAQKNIITVVMAMLDAVSVAMGEDPAYGVEGLVYDKAKNAAAFEAIDGKMKRKFKKLRSITESVAGMVDTIKNAASLSVADQWDENGKPTHYTKMSEEDFGVATNNVTKIVTTFITAMSSPELATQLDDMSKKATKNLTSITGIGGGVGDIVKTVAEMSNGKIATAYDENGKPTEFVNISGINFDSVKENLRKVVTCYTTALGTKEIEDAADDAADSAESLSKIVDPISKVVEATAKIAGQGIDWESLYVNDDIKNQSKISAVIGMWTDALIKIPQNSNNQVNALERSANSTIKLINTIDKANLDKLDKAYSLMNKLSEFSASIRGNFDGLAKCINEQLVDALEKLQEVLEEISDKEFKVSAPAKSLNTPIAMIGKSNPNKENESLKAANAAQAQELADRRRQEQKINDLLEQISDCISNGGFIRVKVQ